MVTTRNMMRSGAESPSETATPKKLPVRSKGDKETTEGTRKSTPKATPRRASAKKDESSRPSSKKKSTVVVELKAESTPSKSEGDQDRTVITGPEQPAPEVEDKIIDDSEAEVEGAPAAQAEEDSDSDEAPEAVSTSKAAVQAKKSAQAANKAILEQAAAQKRKRQDRNTRLQEQAASRKAQKAAAVEKAKGEEDEEDEEGKEEEEDEGQEKPSAVLIKSGRRTRFDLPAELPAEFLDSDDEAESEDADSERKPRKARKLHTAEAQIARESRGPRDEVVGSTLFRVAKKQDERLTPKAQKQSVNAKKALLARDRAPVKARKGFFV